MPRECRCSGFRTKFKFLRGFGSLVDTRHRLGCFPGTPAGIGNSSYFLGLPVKPAKTKAQVPNSRTDVTRRPAHPTLNQPLTSIMLLTVHATEHVSVIVHQLHASFTSFKILILFVIFFNLQFARIHIWYYLALVVAVVTQICGDPIEIHISNFQTTPTTHEFTTSRYHTESTHLQIH